jgi:cytochrome c biogenesis protein CcdA
MVEILVPIFGLALLDSLNPSALAVTLYLLTQPRYGATVITYVGGVFSVYLGIGVGLLVGLDVALAAAGTALEHPIAYGVQGILGAAMLIYSFSVDPKRGGQSERRPRSMNLGAIFVLGASISLLEISTALPYLGAIGIMTSASLSIAQWLPLLVAYNLIFIAPPLLLMASYRLLGSRLQARFDHWRERLQHGTRETFLWIVGILGFLLLADSLRYFEVFSVFGGWAVTRDR